MSLIDTLIDLEDKLWKYKMSKTKKTYLSIEEIQEIMRNNEPMPTNMFNSIESNYIIIPKTIYIIKKKKEVILNYQHLLNLIFYDMMNVSRKLEYNKKEHLTFACLSAYLYKWVHYLIRDGAVFINSNTIVSRKNIIIISNRIIASFLLIQTTSFY